MTSNRTVWFSVNPVEKNIDYYPFEISNLIENEYQNFMTSSDALGYSYFLGEKFFNATIHFNKDGQFYQTTPGITCNSRFGFSKLPGFRTTNRIKLVDGQQKITVYIKKFFNEWRIVKTEPEAEFTFNQSIPENVIINSNIISNLENTYTFWNGDDLSDDNKYVVVWLWCLGTFEQHGAVYNLPDRHWVPYLQNQNALIEEAFLNNKKAVEITLFHDNSKRIIKFNNNYGIQSTIDNNHEDENHEYDNQEHDNNHHVNNNDDENNIKKERGIKRLIMPVKRLNEFIEKMKNQPLNPDLISHLVNEDEIPEQFICPITQNIMSDPVKTVDNFIYDKFAIERWFRTHTSSPCTGLHLNDRSLINHTELYDQIQEFIKLKLEQ